MDTSALFLHTSTQLLQIVAIAFNILIALIPTGFRLLTRKRKKVCYETIIHDDMLKMAGGLQIYYNRTIISKAGLLEIKIRNLGNTEIPHFTNPIKFTFGVNTRVLEVEAVQSNPKMKVAHAIRSDIAPLGQLCEAEVHVAAMNVEDCINVQFLLDKQTNPMLNEDQSVCKVSCQIVGVREGIVEGASLQRTSAKIYSYLLNIAMLLAAICFGNYLRAGLTLASGTSFICLLIVGTLVFWRVNEM